MKKPGSVVSMSPTDHWWQSTWPARGASPVALHPHEGGRTAGALRLARATSGRERVTDAPASRSRSLPTSPDRPIDCCTGRRRCHSGSRSRASHRCGWRCRSTLRRATSRPRSSTWGRRAVPLCSAKAGPTRRKSTPSTRARPWSHERGTRSRWTWTRCSSTDCPADTDSRWSSPPATGVHPPPAAGDAPPAHPLRGVARPPGARRRRRPAQRAAAMSEELVPHTTQRCSPSTTSAWPSRRPR